MPDELETIRDAAVEDAAALGRIYNHYIVGTDVSFEEDPVHSSEMVRRIQKIRAASLPWLVVEKEKQILGYAYAGPWKERSAYRFSVEAAIYLDPGYVGRGTGSNLYRHLFLALQDREVHAVVSGIALPNDASVALHEKFGFEKVAHFREVGFKFNRWIDVGYWQRVLTP